MKQQQGFGFMHRCRDWRSGRLYDSLSVRSQVIDRPDGSTRSLKSIPVLFFKDMSLSSCHGTILWRLRCGIGYAGPHEWAENGPHTSGQRIVNKKATGCLKQGTNISLSRSFLQYRKYQSCWCVHTGVEFSASAENRTSVFLSLLHHRDDKSGYR